MWLVWLGGCVVGVARWWCGVFVVVRGDVVPLSLKVHLGGS